MSSAKATVSVTMQSSDRASTPTVTWSEGDKLNPVIVTVCVPRGTSLKLEVENPAKDAKADG